MLEQSESGYIDKKIFDKWLENVFKKHVSKSREEYNYNGPGVLLLDGCSVHETDYLYEVCKELNIRIFFLPSHSSNQTQPLDLGIFHVHKHFIRKYSLKNTDDSVLVKRIIDIYSAWTRAAIVENITNAFAAAGAIYYIGGHSYTCVVFEKHRATKLLLEMTSAGISFTKKEIWVNMLKSINEEKGKKRMKLSEYNDMDTYKFVPDKVAPQALIRQTINDSALTMYDRLLTGAVPISEVGFSSRDQVQKKKKKSFENESDAAYNDLSFEEKLQLEVDAIFGTN